MSMTEKTEPQITKDMTIGAILEGAPGKAMMMAEVMTQAGLHCVGCGAALYETLEQGVMGHGLGEEVLNGMLEKLNAIVAAETGATAGGAPGDGGNPITLTPAAVAKIESLLAADDLRDHGLRVGVSPGGCSGFSYSLNFEEQPAAGDQVFEQDGLRIFMAPSSLAQLKGLRIDYVETPAESGFKFDNPNAAGAYGCGASFG